jgi:hypothetical protein
MTSACDKKPPSELKSWCPPRLRLMGQPSIEVMSSDNLERLPLEAQLDYLEVSIRRLLMRYPVATMERGNRLILISPVRDGFPIVICVPDDRRLVLEFGGWHEDEFSGLTILHLVDLALSGQLRLKDELINGKASRNSVEISDGKSDHAYPPSSGAICCYPSANKELADDALDAR